MIGQASCCERDYVSVEKTSRRRRPRRPRAIAIAVQTIRLVDSLQEEPGDKKLTGTVQKGSGLPLPT